MKSVYLLFANKLGYLITLLLFLLLIIWWIALDPLNPSDLNEKIRFVWGASYQVIVLWGVLAGIAASFMWGGKNSVMGRAIFAFSIGLLLQAFGQSVYSVYNLYLHVEAPYPSLGDVGFFGSVLFYIYGATLLIKASGGMVSLRTRRVKNASIAILLPLAVLFFSYYEFLQGYEFDWSMPLQIFLDFGYPLGQALYVSLSALVLLLSYKLLGGIMRMPIFVILIALIMQYFADFNFLYQFSRETWYVGGYGDILYMIAYSLMAMALIKIGLTYKKVKEL